MKYVSFLRHASLEAPYESYEKLSLAQLDKLARQEIDPHISDLTVVSSNVKEQLKLDNIGVIYCATSRRTQQTAELIQNDLERQVDIISTTLLDEILFSPEKLIRLNEYKKHGMKIIRNRLFESSISRSHGSESINSIYNRITELEEILRQASESKAVCVTHGFLMRFLQLYFGEAQAKDPSLVTTELVAAQINYPNLQGFRIRLQ